MHPTALVEQWVGGVFACPVGEESHTTVSIQQFMRFFVGSAALWSALGVALESTSRPPVGPPSSTSQLPVGGVIAHSLTAGAATAVVSAQALHSDGWITFTARVLKTGCAFAVTAHEDDTIEKVKHMLEQNVEIRASRQQLIFDGVILDSAAKVGSCIARDLIKAKYEVSVSETDEMIVLLLVHRTKGKKWEHRISASDQDTKTAIGGPAKDDDPAFPHHAQVQEGRAGGPALHRALPPPRRRHHRSVGRVEGGGFCNGYIEHPVSPPCGKRRKAVHTHMCVCLCV